MTIGSIGGRWRRPGLTVLLQPLLLLLLPPAVPSGAEGGEGGEGGEDEGDAEQQHAWLGERWRGGGLLPHVVSRGSLPVRLMVCQVAPERSGPALQGRSLKHLHRRLGAVDARKPGETRVGPVHGHRHARRGGECDSEPWSATWLVLPKPPSLANLRLVSALLRQSTAILDKLGLRVVGWEERECHAVLVCLGGWHRHAHVQLPHRTCSYCTTHSASWRPRCAGDVLEPRKY